ncbi:MAG: hypothetical protein E7256_04105 [Lachnospiraceae bacterium]|nr:hypothetical protein [Lachnospiraceae bacterium]
MFVFTNGLLGLSLGFCKYKKYSFIKSMVAVSLCLCTGMLILNFLIGINVLGVSSVSTGQLVGIIFGVSIIVAIVMLLIFKYLSKVFRVLMNFMERS